MMYLYRIMNTSVREKIKIKIRKFAETIRIEILREYFRSRLLHIHSSLRKGISIFEISLLLIGISFFSFCFPFCRIFFSLILATLSNTEEMYREINDEQRTYLLDYQVLLFLHTLRNNGYDGSTGPYVYLLIFPFCSSRRTF